MSEQLTNGEVVVLRAAIDILRAHGEGFPDDYGQARVVCFAQHAGDAIFEYLNNASTWGGANLTHEQLHGYPEPEPEPVEPQSLRA